MGSSQNAQLFFGLVIEHCPDSAYFERGSPALPRMPQNQCEDVWGDSDIYSYPNWEEGRLVITSAGDHMTNCADTYLAIRESMIDTHWEAEVDPSKVETQPEWRDILHKFCEKHGLPWSEPKWLLTAYYG